MPIIEDGSTPASGQVTCTAGVSGASNSFSPPANSLVVVATAYLNNTNVAATLSCKDSSGNTYTSLIQHQPGSNSTLNAVFCFYYAAAPGSITVTITRSITTGTGDDCYIAPRVLTGAAAVQPGGVQGFATPTSTSWNNSLTTTTPGSLVYVVAGSGGNAGTITGGSNTTLIASDTGDTAGDSCAVGKATATTTVAGPTSFGFNVTTTEPFGWVAAEILPANTNDEPTRALPGPAWRGQFSKSAAKSQPPVLYDYQVSFAGNYSSAGDLAFGASSVGVPAFLETRASIEPSPTWQNQFQHLTKSAVLYDYYPTFAGIFATAGDLAFGAITVGIQAFEETRASIEPSPTWQNQFQHLSKSSVEYDFYPQYGGHYYARPAFVQGVAFAGFATTSTSLVLTLGSVTTTVGNTLILFAEFGQGNDQVSSVTDSKGNAWTAPDAAGLFASGASSVSLASANITTPLVAGDTITVNFASAPNGRATCLEFSGVVPSNRVDQTNGTSQASGTSITVSTTARTSQPVELAISVAGHGGATQGAFTVTPSDQTGDNGVWTQVGYSNDNWTNLAYQVLTSSTVTAATWTTSGTAPMSALVATYESNAGDIAFGSTSVGIKSTITLATDPAEALPGQAWENRFRASLSKNAVLYDFRADPNVLGVAATINVVGVAGVFEGDANVAGVAATINVAGIAGVLEGDANVTGVAATINVAGVAGTPFGVINIPATDPAGANFSPAWQNQFWHAYLSKQAVLFDFQATLDFSGVYLTAGDLAFGAITVGNGFIPTGPETALPGQAWLNRFHGAKSKDSVLWDFLPTSYTQNYGQFCFTGSTEADTNKFGGTAVLASIDVTDGGTATDTNLFGGTAVDANAGLGGTESNDTYGGTGTEENTFGGFLFGGCYV
jgi:hypothetical protein